MKWFKRWLYRQIQQGEKLMHVKQAEDYPVPTPVSRFDQLFGNCTPAIVAFKIDNGYVIRSVDVSDSAYSGNTGTYISSGYVYCKDHAAIAEHIVTEAAKAKMGIADHHANVGNQAIMQAKSGYAANKIR